MAEKAALDAIRLDGAVDQRSDGVIREVLRIQLWQWLRDHKDMKVPLRFWIVRKTFRLEDFFFLFKLLLGDEPIFIP